MAKISANQTESDKNARHTLFIGTSTSHTFLCNTREKSKDYFNKIQDNNDKPMDLK